MISPDSSPLFITSSPLFYESESEERGGIKTLSGDDVSYRKEHFNLLRFDLLIRNLSDEAIVFDINDISVAIKNRKTGKQYATGRNYIGASSHAANCAISQADAKTICLAHLKEARERALETARDNAKVMATTNTSTTSSSGGVSTSRTNSVGVGASVGASAGAGAVVGSGGYYAAGAGVGASASIGAAASSSNRYVSSFGVSRTNTTSFNNAVYYQALEDEMDKARSFVNNLREESEEELKELEITKISIPARGYVKKIILASEQKGLSNNDDYILEFTISGIKYSLSVDNRVIINYYDQYK